MADETEIRVQWAVQFPGYSPEKYRSEAEAREVAERAWARPMEDGWSGTKLVRRTWTASEWETAE